MKKPGVGVSLANLSVAQTCGENTKPGVDVSLAGLRVGTG